MSTTIDTDNLTYDDALAVVRGALEDAQDKFDEAHRYAILSKHRAIENGTPNLPKRQQQDRREARLVLDAVQDVALRLEHAAVDRG